MLEVGNCLDSFYKFVSKALGARSNSHFNPVKELYLILVFLTKILKLNVQKFQKIIKQGAIFSPLWRWCSTWSQIKPASGTTV